MNKPKRGYFDAYKPAVTPATPILDRLRPHNCFRYPFCSAQACPMESDWKRRKFYTGEATCTLLKEAVKEKTADTFFSLYFAESAALLDEIRAIIPVMINSHPILRKELAAAAESGSRYKKLEGENPDAGE